MFSRRYFSNRIIKMGVTMDRTITCTEDAAKVVEEVRQLSKKIRNDRQLTKYFKNLDKLLAELSAIEIIVRRHSGLPNHQCHRDHSSKIDELSAAIKFVDSYLLFAVMRI